MKLLILRVLTEQTTAQTVQGILRTGARLTCSLMQQPTLAERCSDSVCCEAHDVKGGRPSGGLRQSLDGRNGTHRFHRDFDLSGRQRLLQAVTTNSQGDTSSTELPFIHVLFSPLILLNFQANKHCSVRDDGLNKTTYALRVTICSNRPVYHIACVQGAIGHTHYTDSAVCDFI